MGCLWCDVQVTQQPRGCAFVSYATRAEAESAIQHLDRQIQLPGALSQLEVSCNVAMHTRACATGTHTCAAGVCIVRVHAAALTPCCPLSQVRFAVDLGKPESHKTSGYTVRLIPGAAPPGS